MLNNRKWVKYGKNREKQEIFKWLIIRTMNYFISLWFPWLVPALALGGKEAIDNIHILKTIPYIEMSPNLSGIWNKCNNRLLTKRDNAQTAFPANLLKGSQRVHWKRVVNFALFFYARSNSATINRRISSTRTNRDSAGQMRTLFSAYPNIAYLVAIFGRDYSRNH